MDNTQIKKEFKKMKEMEFPQELHGRIMRSIYLRQFKVPLVMINLLLFINFTVSTWHLWRTFREQVMSVSGSNPEIASLYANLLKAIQNLPLETSAIFFVNLGLLGGGLYLLMRLNYILVGRTDQK